MPLADEGGFVDPLVLAIATVLGGIVILGRVTYRRWRPRRQAPPEGDCLERLRQRHAIDRRSRGQDA